AGPALRPGLQGADVHGLQEPHVAQPPACGRRRRQGRRRQEQKPGDIPMKASRITAIGLVAATGLWIASGHLLPHETAESRAAIRTNEGDVKKPFRVAVLSTSVVPHGRRLIMSGRTEADKRVTLTARTGGVLTELKVKRGTWVKEGDVIAILSDEARESQVTQAKSLVVQRA